MRVLLTGGGTSGHVNPALAIADIIKARHPNAEIAYVGTERGIEKRLVDKEFYTFYPVNIRGIKRSLSPSNIKTAYTILTAPAKARKIIKSFRPDIVIGTGGYVCWPTLKAAADMGIPTLLHESNSYPGLAVRKLEGKVDVILTNFENTEEHLKYKQKVVNVGNPVRQSFGKVSREDARARLGIPDSVKFLVLSFGGSLGAPKIGEAAIAVMKGFAKDREDVMCVHAGGKNNFEDAKKQFISAGLSTDARFVLKDYIYDMPTYMAAADVIICRAGAMTLTEIAMMGKAAILVPSPHVTANHQYKNARALSDMGAAVLIEEKDVNETSVCEAVERIYSDEQYAKGLRQSARAFAREDTDELIYGEISRLIKNKAKIKKR